MGFGCQDSILADPTLVISATIDANSSAEVYVLY